MNDPVLFVCEAPSVRQNTPAPANTTGTSRGHRVALVVALVFTMAAAGQQAAIAIGFGGRLPGWQPWPYLLVAGPAWILSRPHQWRGVHCARLVASADRLRRVPAIVYLTGVLVLAAAVWAWLQDKEPYLGHEEAVYANKARSWLDDGIPAAGWGIYRPLGLPFLGRIALAVHNDVGALRAVALILTLFTLTTTYAIASRWMSAHRAVLVVLVLVSGLGFLRRMPEFLNDIGSTGLLLIVVYLITRAHEKDGSRALLVLPIVVLCVFYFRYGVLGSLLAVFLAASLAYSPRTWLARWKHLAIAGTVLAIGLTPHLLHAHEATGSPLGIVLSATSQANRQYVGDGLVYYLAVFPYRLAGDLGALLMAAGIAATARAAHRLWRPAVPTAVSRPTDVLALRRDVFLGTSALFVFVTLGLATDGEPRFVYVSVVLLLMLGIARLPDLTGNLTRGVMVTVGALGLLTVLGTAQVIAHGAMPSPSRLGDSTVPVALQLRSAGPCLLVTGYEPEMGWYSGCDAVTYAQYRGMSPPAGTRISFITFECGRLQPDANGMRLLTEGQKVVITEVPTGGSVGDATIYTVYAKTPAGH